MSKGSSSSIPPLEKLNLSTLDEERRPLFTKDGHHADVRSKPKQPLGQFQVSPTAVFDAAGREQSNSYDAVEMKLPGISFRGDADTAAHNSIGQKSHELSREKADRTIETDRSPDVYGDPRTDEAKNYAAQSPPAPASLLTPEVAERLPSCDTDGGVGTAAAFPRGGEYYLAEARSSPEINLAARKAQRVAEVRTIAQEVVRNVESDGGHGIDDAERSEIERALAAVDETRRKRLERQQAEHGGAQQSEIKTRRRQEKREQLMRKRKDMENRLEEEASKMAELTRSAKKKGEIKFMSEEARREAEERIRAEAEVVARLEAQASEMAVQREHMQRRLANHKDEEAAEFEATSSALRKKRALVEARMKEEEEEIQLLSENAKREVEAKMIAEAAAIADMERQALQMSAKRAELEVEMSRTIQLENTLAQEARQLCRKREVIEAKMRQEEAELQKVTDEAQKQVLANEALEAATIAGMEGKAAELAAERLVTASRTADQCAADVDGGHIAASNQVVIPAEEVPADPSPIKALDAPPAPEGNSSADCQPSLTKLSADSGGQDGHGAELDVSVEPLRVEHESGQREEVSGIASHAVTLRPNGNCTDDYLRNREYSNGDAVKRPQCMERDFSEAGRVAFDICTDCLTSKADMPIPHLAAATGHLACLGAAGAENPALLMTFDSAGRNPLFYACANVHVDIVNLLLSKDPQCCHARDLNGDTPLHASALAGSGVCCRLLLQQEHCEVDPLNTMQMTPAHVAASNDVLEVLSQHGANLNAKDVDSRTPLFIACATDRLEKAEFLCELLECEGQDLSEADKRGDSPMHAAAYNGSTACLLLLLQYGVAPDVRNTKGHRPIDLAARRGQSACEKILMEYQLHHQVNNSYFDSVLFLATLEGHKKCKEGLVDDEECGDGAEGTIAGSPLGRPASLWSLRRGRSVRLEYWGDWIAYEDQNAQSVFWYNHVAQKSQWNAPREVRENSARRLAGSSMRLTRRGDWIEYTLPDGNAFFYNDNNNEFQWERPEQLSRRPSIDDCDEDEAASIGTAADNTSTIWVEFKDPESDRVFWYNNLTGESQWEVPAHSKVHDNAADATREDWIAPDEDAREITSIEDLFTSR